MSKFATISVVGRPSSGKSTLINIICETKVSITSNTPQTTRNIIKGVYTDQRGQLVFVDTPGYHKSEKIFNQQLKQLTLNALHSNDIILYLLDVKREILEEEKELIGILNKAKKPILCLLNKIDVASDDEIKRAKEAIDELFVKKPYLLTISALKDENVDDALIKLFELAKEGPAMYDEETRTDQDLEFRLSEIIREKATRLVKKELPHAIFVEIEDLEYKEEEKHVWVRAVIYVEKDSQKGILVGKAGVNIREIRVQSHKEIQRIFPGSTLLLDIRVKSKAKWRTNSLILKKTCF